MKNEKDFYIEKFSSKTFVIKMGGEVIENEKKLKELLLDLKTLFDLGIKIVLVHGGGNQFDFLSKQLGIKPQKKDGRRITSKEDLKIVKMLYGGTLNLEILSIMREIGLSGIRVSGIDGNLVKAEKRKIKEIDFGFAGDVLEVNPKIINILLENNFIPIIPPITADQKGQILNTNADTMAMEIAARLKAEKLIFLTNVSGLLDADNKLISTISIEELENLRKKEVIKDGMKVKTLIAQNALEKGVKRVHILNGAAEKSLLLEVFAKEGIGTLIVKNTKEKEDYLKNELG